MRLAVVICSDSQPSRLAATLRSVEAAAGVDEIVVASDGIDQETDALAFAARRRCPRLAYTRGPRLGPAANRNAALAAVTADVVTFLEAGDILDPGLVPATVAAGGPGRVVALCGGGGAGTDPGPMALRSTLLPVGFLRDHPFVEPDRAGRHGIDLPMAARSAGLNVVAVPAGNGAAEGRDDVSPARLRRPGTARLAAADVSRAVAASGGPIVSTSIVVPTYRRPEDLRACLAGIEALSPPPSEVVIVRHGGDDEAAAVLAGARHRAHEVVVAERGQVVQMLAGAAAATGDVVAFLDDDAVPRRDWLSWLLAPYGDPTVGGVGGRDLVHGPGGSVVDGRALRVGRLSRWGRATGNHHLGAGWPRAVEILKGANCSFRREVVRFPLGLRGAGVSMANDLAASLWAVSSGHRLVYEPRALVDHYPGRRFDADVRTAPSRRALLDHVYNETYAIGSVRPDLRARRLAYVLAIGDHTSPGAVRSLVALARREESVRGRFLDTARTVLQATRDARARPLRFVAPARDPAAAIAGENGRATR